MPSLETPSLTLDEIDDLLYFTRVNESEELQQTLSELSQKYSCSHRDIILACVDPESGKTLLHYCSANGFVEILKTLLSTIGLHSESTGEGRERQVSESVVNAKNKEGNTPLHWASVNGQLDVVKILIDAGADVSIENAAGYLAVSEAERAGKGNVVEYLLEKSQQSTSPEDLADLADDSNAASNGSYHVSSSEDADMNG